MGKGEDIRVRVSCWQRQDETIIRGRTQVAMAENYQIRQYGRCSSIRRTQQVVQSARALGFLHQHLYLDVAMAARESLNLRQQYGMAFTAGLAIQHIRHPQRQRRQIAGGEWGGLGRYCGRWRRCRYHFRRQFRRWRRRCTAN